MYANGKFDYGEETKIEEISLEGGKDYTVGYNAPPELIEFFKQEPNDSIKPNDEYKTKVETTYYYSAITKFKRAIFECTDVHYNESTGRIDEMTFEQIK